MCQRAAAGAGDQPLMAYRAGRADRKVGMPRKKTREGRRPPETGWRMLGFPLRDNLFRARPNQVFENAIVVR